MKRWTICTALALTVGVVVAITIRQIASRHRLPPINAASLIGRPVEVVEECCGVGLLCGAGFDTSEWRRWRDGDGELLVRFSGEEFKDHRAVSVRYDWLRFRPSVRNDPGKVLGLEVKTWLHENGIYFWEVDSDGRRFVVTAGQVAGKWAWVEARNAE